MRGLRLLGPTQLPGEPFEYRLLGVERRERLAYGHTGRVESTFAVSLVGCLWLRWRSARAWTLIVAGVRLHYRRD